MNPFADLPKFCCQYLNEREAIMLLIREKQFSPLDLHLNTITKCLKIIIKYQYIKRIKK